MEKNVSMTWARQKLLIVWSIGSAIPFVLIFIQTIIGVFDIKIGNNEVDNIAKDVWGWFIPSVLPTFSLMIGVLVSESFMVSKDKMASRFLYRLSFILSAFYLITILSTYVAAFASPVDKSPLALLKQSNLWLGPFQGLVSASLGAFFVSKK